MTYVNPSFIHNNTKNHEVLDRAFDAEEEVLHGNLQNQAIPH